MPDGLFPHPPRLEPDVPLSGHPAQHFQISLGLSSVAIDAEYLLIFQAVCLPWVFEPYAGYDVVNVYLVGVKRFLACRAYWTIT